MADEVTEFEWLDPEELHLVSDAANRFTPLVAKAATNQKGTTKMTKLEKKLRKAVTADLSGGASTARDRLSGADLDALLRQATSQTRDNVEGNRLAKAVLKGFDDRVSAAQAALAAAGDEFAKMAAATELRTAGAARLRAKMVIKENAHQRGVKRSHMGPAVTDIFGGSMNTLPADRQIFGYTA